MAKLRRETPRMVVSKTLAVAIRPRIEMILEAIALPVALMAVAKGEAELPNLAGPTRPVATNPTPR